MWMVNDVVERRGTSGSEKVLNGSTDAEPGNRGNHKTKRVCRNSFLATSGV
jgi:hypothetical protein